MAAISDVTGNVVERYRYDAYGKRTVLAADGTTTRTAGSLFGNDYGFTGLRHDGESGLIYGRSRMGQPMLGRWINRDPIGYADGPNLYCAYFVPNSTDPYGLGEGEVHIVIYPTPGIKPDQTTPDEFEKQNEAALKRLIARGFDGQVIEVKDINDANKKVNGVPCKCVKILDITGHGNSFDDSAIQDVGSTATHPKTWAGETGFGIKKVDKWFQWFRSDEYTFFGMNLFNGMNFCRPCIVNLRGCNVGKTNAGKLLMKEVARITGCTVNALSGSSYPDKDNGLPGPESGGLDVTVGPPSPGPGSLPPPGGMNNGTPGAEPK